MKLNFTFLSILFVLPIISFSQYGNSSKYSTDKDGRIYYSNNAKEKLSIVESNQPNDKSGKDLSITWQNGDTDLSKNNGNDSWDPRIDVGPDGTVGVVYNDLIVSAYLQKIFFRQKEFGSDIWSDSIFVDAGGEIGGRNCHMPAIAFSPNGDIHVIYNVWAYENVRNYLGYSYYDAANDSWADGEMLSQAGGSISHFYGHHEVYSTDDNLPVVFWGFDNRIASNVEEVYMKYYDGTHWSDDILVSSPDGFRSAGYPHVTSMGNQQAMIVFTEKEDGIDNLMYRIYDEVTHELSDIRIVPDALINITYDNTDIVNKNDGTLLIGTIHMFNDPWSDTLRMISYNIENAEFTTSEYQYTDLLLGPLTKTISLSCNTAGECAVIFSDVSGELNGYMEFDYETGFSESETITNQEMNQQDLPDSKFDFMGNLHVVWDDLRNTPPTGNSKRDVFYKMGTNTTDSYTIDFNITTDGTTPLPDAEVSLNALTQTTDVNGYAIFEDVIAGEYDLSISKETYVTYIETISVNQDETFDINLLLNSINSFANSGISIFPNPNKGQINIAFPNKINTAEISVVDISGKLVHKKIIYQQKALIDLDVENGYYLLRINYDGKSVTSSIVVE